MAVFPRQETDVLSPANTMIAGYTENPLLFPHADLAALETATDDFRNGLLVAICFRATANDPGKLELIGWGKKAPAQPTSPPNQPRTLEAIMQGPGTGHLDWKTSMIGGKGGPVRTYVIYRREQPQGGGAFGSWEQAGMALETHALLSNQSQRRQIEYRIIAVNGAGVSIPSNTAAVVL